MSTDTKHLCANVRLAKTRAGCLRTGVSVVVFLSMCTSRSLAQELVEGGVKGGLSLATIDLAEERVGDLENRPGFVGGVFFGFPIAAQVLLQPEALVTQKGGRFDTGPADINVRITYLEIPMLVKYRVTRDNVRPVIFGGPALAFKLQADANVSGAADFFEGEDIDDDIKGYDAGFVVGGGIDWNRFLFDVRYTLSLININTIENAGVVKIARFYSWRASFGDEGQTWQFASSVSAARARVMRACD